MYADKHTVVYPTKIKHKVFMVTCSLVEELKMKKKIGCMQIYLLISEFRIYASLTLRFAYKRVFVYMQLGYMQAILPVPSTCIYPSSTVVWLYGDDELSAKWLGLILVACRGC